MKSKTLLSIVLVTLMCFAFALATAACNPVDPDKIKSITEQSSTEISAVESDYTEPETSSTETAPATLTSVEMKSLPTKTAYAYGEELDLTGAVLTAYYDDETSEDVDLTADMVTGYSATTAGEQTLTATYEGMTATFTVTVAERIPVIVSVEMNTLPTKTAYAYGEELDVTGASIFVTYDTDTSEEVAVTAAMVTGYTATTAGEQTLTVTYEGFTATFTVTVAERIPVLTAIELTSLPAKTAYNYRDALDLSGAVLTATYDDDTTAEYELTAAMISGYSSETIGDQTLTVTYTENEVTLTTEFTVNVNNLYFVSGTNEDLVITEDANGPVYTMPNKKNLTVVFKGTSFAGGSISFDMYIPTMDEYSNTNSTGFLYAYTENGSDRSYYVTGRSYHTGNFLSYHHDTAGGGFAWEYKTFKADGVMNDVTRTYHVEIVWDPDLVTVVGEDTYYGGVHYIIDGVYLGTNAFKVNYTGGEIGLHAVSPGTVISNLKLDDGAILRGLSVTTAPAKTEYTKGEDLDLTGIVATPSYYYNKAAAAPLGADALTVTGYDKDTIGDQTLTVSYTENGRTVSTEMTVRVMPDVELASIAVKTAPTKTLYNLTDALVIDGLTITATYSDDSTADYAVTDAMVSGFDSETAGTKNVTVTYAEGTVEVTTTFAVKVIDDYVFTSGGKADEGGVGGLSTSSDIAVTEENGVRVFTAISDKHATAKLKDVTFTGGSITFKVKAYSNGYVWALGVMFGATTLDARYAVDKFYSVGRAKDGFVKVQQRNTAMVWQNEDTALATANAEISEYGTEYTIKVIWDNNSHVHCYVNGVYAYTATTSKKLTGSYIGVYFPGGCQGAQVYDIVIDATETQPALMNDLVMDVAPSKLVYAVGEDLNLSDMVLTASYATGEAAKTVSPDDLVITGYDNNTLGAQTATLSYTENGITKSVTLDVVVAESVISMTGLTIKSNPTKTEYALGETLDMTGAVVTVSYDDNSTEDITVTSDDVTGFNGDLAGDKAVVFAYTFGGVTMSVTFDMAVVLPANTYKVLYIGSDLIVNNNAATYFADMYKELTTYDVYSQAITTGSLTFADLQDPDDDHGFREYLTSIKWDAVILQITRRITATGTDVAAAEKTNLANLIPLLKANADRVLLLPFVGEKNPTIYTVDGTGAYVSNGTETSTKAANTEFFNDLAIAWATEYEIEYIPYGMAYLAVNKTSNTASGYTRGCCFYIMLSGNAIPAECTVTANNYTYYELCRQYAEEYCRPLVTTPEP